MIQDSASLLATLLLCALMGQGIGAITGFKRAAVPAQSIRSRHGEFNAACVTVSLMTGCIAGILAGMMIGLDHVRG